MIDEKKIIEATNSELKSVQEDYVDDEFGVLYPTEHREIDSLIRDVFADGVYWAISEFKKSLWHKPKEIPETNRWILVEFMGDRLCYDTIQSAFNNWAKIRSYCHITKWCYIDDILPKGGEE